MTRMAQRNMDGISFNSHKARFTGSVPLEDEEADAASIDEVLVMVVVAKVDDVQAKLDRAGDLNRINVMKVTDTRLLTGDLKAILVDRLGLYGADTVDPTAPPSPDVDLETGEVQTFPSFVSQEEDEVFSPAGSNEHQDPFEVSFDPPGIVENGAFIPEAETQGTVGHIGQRDPRARPERSGGNGPKSKPYNEEDGGPSVPSGEVLGRIGRPGITSIRTWGVDPE